MQLSVESVTSMYQQPLPSSRSRAPTLGNPLPEAGLDRHCEVVTDVDELEAGQRDHQARPMPGGSSMVASAAAAAGGVVPFAAAAGAAEDDAAVQEM